MKTFDKYKSNKATLMIGKMRRTLHIEQDEMEVVAKRVVAEIVGINERGYNPVTTRGEHAICKRWATALDLDKRCLWKMVDELLQRHYDERILAMYKAAKKRGIFIMG